jgi:glycerophosphoryl diester phosphodiesterase
VSHDIHVDTTTDAAARFPERRRADGRLYAIDFTWAELRSLKVTERTAPGGGKPVFPRRFPSRPDDGAAFRLCTLEEQIALIHGLNASTGRRVGLYPEIKAPAFHRREGRDPGAALLALLRRHGYTGPDDPVFVQCFDPAELKRLRTELGCELRLVQLIGDNGDEDIPVDYDTLRTPIGLREIARYAQGIGPHLGHIASGIGADGRPQFTMLVADAHAAGLLVHPYTFRSDALPRGVPTIEALLAVFIDAAKVDGVFIDQPDAAVRFLQRLTPATP